MLKTILQNFVFFIILNPIVAVLLFGWPANYADFIATQLFISVFMAIGLGAMQKPFLDMLKKYKHRPKQKP